MYPEDRVASHHYQIPADRRLCVKDGIPIACPNRDVRFPMVWEVKYHPKSHSGFVTKNWVVLMDTSEEARRVTGIFDASLKTPLGPDAFMEDYGMCNETIKHVSTLANFPDSGLMRVEAGTVVYGRSLNGPVDFEGYRTADDDIFLCANGDGWVF